MCIYAYIYIHIHTYVYIYMYICIYIYIYLFFSQFWFGLILQPKFGFQFETFVLKVQFLCSLKHNFPVLRNGVSALLLTRLQRAVN